MPKLNKPDVIFFDWDDTIFTNTFYARETLKKMVKRHQTKLSASVFPVNPEVSLLQSVYNKFASMAGLPLDKIMANMFKDSTEYFVAEFRRQYVFAKRKHGIRFLDGAIKTLQMIRDMGIPMALISNKGGDMIRGEVKDARLSSMFFAVIGNGDYPESKPSALPIIEAVKSLSEQTGKKVNLSNCFMIGDAEPDVLCAKNSGCVPIHIGEIDYLPVQTQKDCLSGKIICVNNHAELQKLLNSIEQKSGTAGPRNSSLFQLKKAANR